MWLAVVTVRRWVGLTSVFCVECTKLVGCRPSSISACDLEAVQWYKLYLMTDNRKDESRRWYFFWVLELASILATALLSEFFKRDCPCLPLLVRAFDHEVVNFHLVRKTLGFGDLASLLLQLGVGSEFGKSVTSLTVSRNFSKKRRIFGLSMESFSYVVQYSDMWQGAYVVISLLRHHNGSPQAHQPAGWVMYLRTQCTLPLLASTPLRYRHIHLCSLRSAWKKCTEGDAPSSLEARPAFRHLVRPHNDYEIVRTPTIKTIPSLKIVN